MYSYDTAIAGLNELPILALRLVNTAGKVSPLFTDLLYRISLFPGVSSSHSTCTLLPDTAIAGSNEPPSLLLRFIVVGSKSAPSLL
jgi:hypothetical protein